MERHGQVIEVKPGCLEEYRRLHAAVWPEVLAILSAHHIRNYSIYYKDGFLFTYYEYDGTDYAADMAAVAAEPVTQEWWKVCKPCHTPLATRAEGEWWAEMEEVFHLE